MLCIQCSPARIASAGSSAQPVHARHPPRAAPSLPRRRPLRIQHRWIRLQPEHPILRPAGLCGKYMNAERDALSYALATRHRPHSAAPVPCLRRRAQRADVHGGRAPGRDAGDGDLAGLPGPETKAPDKGASVYLLPVVSDRVCRPATRATRASDDATAKVRRAQRCSRLI